MKNPFFPKFIVLQNTHFTDTLLTANFHQQKRILHESNQWLVVRETPRFAVFSLIRNPQPSQFTVCIYSVEGEALTVLHHNTDSDILKELMNSLSLC